jgi:hypothetical protein
MWRDLLYLSLDIGARRRSTNIPHPVILNVTEGGVRDLLYLSFNIGARRRSANTKRAPILRFFTRP